MKRERPSIAGTLLRSLRLRCPVCGRASIIQRPFKVRHDCPSCGALFMREEGFFVGAIMVNVVTTEAFILLLYMACLLVPGIDYQMVLVLLFVSALLFPILFYHHSWSIWLGFDHIIEGLPQKGATAPLPPAEDEWPDHLP